MLVLPGRVAAQYTIATTASSSAGTIFDGNGVAVDSSGNVYATGTVPGPGGVGAFPVILKVSASGTTVVAGSNQPNGLFPGCGDSATAIQMTDLGGLAVDSSANIYVAQLGNGPVLQVSGGTANCLLGGQFFGAFGVVADNAGNVFFSTGQSSIVYEAPFTGGLIAVAGTGTVGCTGASIGTPHGLALDSSGNLYIADPFCNVIWKVTPSGLTAFAGIPGNANTGFSGDGGPATQATLSGPNGVAVDASGNVYITDTLSARIRKVTAGIISTIAGDGNTGSSGDSGLATGAELDSPYSIAVGADGKIYIGEAGDIADGGDRIRELIPPTATHFAVTFPPSATPGVAFSFTVTALDSSNNVFTTYLGTVHFSSSDPQAALPANYTFIPSDSGTHTFSGTLQTSGNQTITVTDTSNMSVTGTSSTIAVSAVINPPTMTKSFGAPSIPLNGTTILTLAIQNPNAGAALTGVAFTDIFPTGLAVANPSNFSSTCGGIAAAVTGSASVSLSGATLAASASCVFSLNVTGSAPGTFTNAAAVTSTNGGQQQNVASATLQVVVPPSIQMAFNPSTIAMNNGSGLTFTIVASPLNPVGLTGVAFTDTLPTGLTAAGVPGAVCGGVLTTTSTLPTIISLAGASIPAGGQCQFIVFVTGAAAGQYTNTTGNITSTNGGTGNTASANLTVVSVATHFGVSAPASAISGTSFNFTVTAIDSSNKVVPSYRGTARFTSTDSQAILPSSYTFTPADAGVHTFPAVLKTAGSQTITATDTTSASVTGTSGPIAVSSPDFSLTAVSPITVKVGGTAPSTVTVNSLSGFNSAVSLSVPTPPSGVSASLSSSSVTPPAGSSATSTVTVALAPFVTPAVLTLNVTGNAGSLTHSASLTINVTADSSSTANVIGSLFAAGCIGNSGIANALTRKLSAAQSAISAGNVQMAINILGALKNQIQAQAGKNIASSCAAGGVSFNPANVLLVNVQSLIDSLRTSEIPNPITGYVAASTGMGVAGTTLSVLDANGNTVGTATTDITGFYFFPTTGVLAPGANYTISITVLPSGFSVATPTSQPFPWQGASLTFNFSLN